MDPYLIEKEQTLLEALKGCYPESSRRTLEIWIKNGRISIDGVKMMHSRHQVMTGQKMLLSSKMRPAYKGIKYLYQDRYLIAIEKPAHLLSVSSENPDEVNALGFVREDFHTETIFPVHRLDREASGVLLFARGKESQERLDRLFETHDLEREYIAIVEGHLDQKEGTFESYLLETENFHVITTTPELGKFAKTHYQVLHTSRQFSYLRLFLETGRKHQIRVHCKEAGHPILGDKRYRSKINPVKRLCLHALSLSLIHPFTQQKIKFLAPPPKAFLDLGFKSWGQKRNETHS